MRINNLAVLVLAVAAVLAGAVGVSRGTAAGKARQSAAKMPGYPQFDKRLIAIKRDVNSFWAAAFESSGLRYRTPRLFIVDPAERIKSPCSTKPLPFTVKNAFWCSGDGNVYLFSQFLRNEILSKAGEFGVAYVIAHEMGHHVQGQLGLWRVVAQRHISTIQTETQADCFAGIWAKSAFDRGLVDEQDVDRIISVTDLVGDALGTPAKVEGAHGQSGLRAAWFLNGFRSGSPRDCQTF